MGKDFSDFISLDRKSTPLYYQGEINRINYQRVLNNIPIPITLWELKGEDFVLVYSNKVLEEITKTKLFTGIQLSKAFIGEYRNIFSHTSSKKENNSSVQMMIDKDLLLICHSGFWRNPNNQIPNQKWEHYTKEPFKTIIKQSPVSIIITDIRGNIEYINPKFIEVTGYLSDEVIGKNPRILKAGNKSSEEYKNLWDTILSGNVWKGEFINKRKNGEFYYEYAVIAPIKDKYGVINNFIAIKEDITKLKETDNELRRSEKFAALGKMAAYVSHEIKSPLTSIRMNVDLISKAPEIPEIQKKSIHIIQKEIKRLDKLLQDVSSFTREKELEVIDLELHELVNSVVELFSPLITSKGISLTNKIDKVRIYGDSQKLYAVFMHLLENSIEAMTDGGRIEFNSELDAGSNNLFIYIKDNGPGIQNGIKPFEPFITTKFSGTGLGLPIVDKIMRKHSGSIELCSTEPGNTVFRLTFPIKFHSNGKNINN